ncbi:hypothetical protein SCLCIDRAFT_1221934 [Scleroderma citrinum Foug A]|uniref:Uncharacterized protein n=1 Tax=Scleroderma citrinum Foug A TaxID=1036808 RepID=A0A0C2ZPB0_9AGAM|nr:hypothetical protein SCLCIDRAFT_1221934 [Scleroderma citrinum Foug A]
MSPSQLKTTIRGRLLCLQRPHAPTSHTYRRSFFGAFSFCPSEACFPISISKTSRLDSRCSHSHSDYHSVDPCQVICEYALFVYMRGTDLEIDTVALSPEFAIATSIKLFMTRTLFSNTNNQHSILN